MSNLDHNRLNALQSHKDGKGRRGTVGNLIGFLTEEERENNANSIKPNDDDGDRPYFD